MTDSALIRINDIEIHLCIDETNTKPHKNDNFQEGWKANGYNVLLKLKVIKDEDEEVYCKGTIEIITKSCNVQFKIHGHTIT